MAIQILSRLEWPPETTEILETPETAETVSVIPDLPLSLIPARMVSLSYTSVVCLCVTLLFSLYTVEQETEIC